MLEPITGTLLAFTAAITIITECMTTIVTAILTLSGLCASLAAILPHPKRGSVVYKYVYKAINIVGCNLGKAKNVSTEK